jgi:hypothetical protein
MKIVLQPNQKMICKGLSALNNISLKKAFVASAGMIEEIFCIFIASIKLLIESARIKTAVIHSNKL